MTSIAPGEIADGSRYAAEWWCRLRAGAGEEAGRDEEHAEAVRGEQVEGTAEEVGVGVLLAVGAVGVLGDRDAAGAVGRVREDQAEAAGVLGPMLADPAIEGAVVDGDLGPERLEHARRELGPLDDEPAERVEPVARGGLDEPADAGGRLERADDAFVVGQIVDERADDPGDLAGDLRGRVVLVDEPAGLGRGEAERELLRCAVDREGRPTRSRRPRARRSTVVISLGRLVAATRIAARFAAVRWDADHRSGGASTTARCPRAASCRSRIVISAARFRARNPSK